MKKLMIVMLAVLAVVGGGTAAVYAAGGFGSTSSEVAVIGENVEMEILSPLQVEGWGCVAFDFYEGQANPVWPGQKVGFAEITIHNLSPILQAAYLSAQPIVADTGWPCFDVVAHRDTRTFRYEAINIEPGESVSLSVEITVSYGSQVSSFSGLKLIVSPGAPISYLGKG